jgi:hypothetical protein
MEMETYQSLLAGSVLVDVKGIFDPVKLQNGGIRLWRLYGQINHFSYLINKKFDKPYLPI